MVATTDSGDWTEEQAAAVAEVKQTREGVAIKMHGKLAALDSLAKHLGLFASERVDHRHLIGGGDGAPEIRFTFVEPKPAEDDQAPVEAEAETRQGDERP